jgi:hypothetical protein
VRSQHFTLNSEARMSDDDFDKFHSEYSDSVPIPAAFHSLELDGPFEKCLLCDCELRSSGQPYMIERVFKRAEPIIEYAMCQSCITTSNEELSTESRQSIREWFQASFNPLTRLREMDRYRDDSDVQSLFSECAITGTAAGNCQERQIMAMCQGDRLIVGFGSPMMLSGAAIEQIVELLSEQTRGWMQDFVSDNFGMPPEFCDSPDMLPLLI